MPISSIFKGPYSVSISGYAALLHVAVVHTIWGGYKMLEKLMGWALLAVALMGVSACNSNDARLKSAIAENLSEGGNPLACAAVLNEVGQFPFAYHADGMLNHGADKRMLDQLVQNGFLSARSIKVKSIYGGLNGEVVGSPQATEYALTPLGSKYVQGNKFCLPNEMADTEVQPDGSSRTLMVTQYFSGVRNDETLRLSKLLAGVNPNLPLLMERDLPIKFVVRTSVKADILSIEQVS